MDWLVSQPLSPLWVASASRVKSRHFRGLARHSFVSAAENSRNSAPAGEFFGRVSGREISISEFRWQRLGSKSLRAGLIWMQSPYWPQIIAIMSEFGCKAAVEKECVAVHPLTHLRRQLPF